MHVHRRLTPSALRRHLPARTVRLRLTMVYSGLFLASGMALLAVTYLLLAHEISGPLSASNGRTGTLGPPPTNPSGTVHAPTANPLEAQRSADLHQFLVTAGIALTVMVVVSFGLGWIMSGRVLRPLRAITAATRQISEDNLHERLALRGPDDELHDLGDTINGLLSRLETAFDAQQRFVANASHELRTPLTLSRAMLQVALADPDLTLDLLRAVCDDVIESDREQEHLIEALLTLARSQRGLDHREPVDLLAVTNDVLQTHHADADARAVTITAALHPARLAGDTCLIERLVSNLVQNAIRHNVDNGHVHVELGTYAGHATLRITNTGPRIPKQQLQRLLQPFQRLDGERTAHREGLGLGLSIVHAIASTHHATLALRNQDRGGLDIEVAFPGIAA